MKKLISALLTLAMVLTLPVSVQAQAADEVTLYAVEAETADLADASEKTDHALYEDTYGYISLKSDTIGKIIFNVEVETAGKYGLDIVYAAKEGSAARKLGYSVNDGATTLVNLTCAADWDTFKEHKVNVTLNAGKNTIVISTPSDYDNETVKTPNVYAIQYVLKEAAETKEEVKETTSTATAGTTYTVVKGDTLRKIATAAYGKESDWKKIWEANKELIENPDLIFRGMQLVIPE